jgi:hypothetical protein
MQILLLKVFGMRRLSILVRIIKIIIFVFIFLILLASKYGHVDVVQFLLNKHVDSNVRDDKNVTPIYLGFYFKIIRCF